MSAIRNVLEMCVNPNFKFRVESFRAEKGKLSQGFVFKTLAEREAQ